MQNNIFPGDTGSGFPRQFNLDRRGNLEPVLTGSHACCHIGRSDARGESTQGTISAGVGIGTNHTITGTDNSLFREQRVFYSDCTDIIKVFDMMFFREITGGFAKIGRFNIFAGRIMIQSNDDLFRIKNFGKAGFFKNANRNRCGNIVAQNDIQISFDQIPRMHFRESGMCSQDFLGHCHSHYSAS